MKGSVMLALAESSEKVLEALREDIYCKSGVWDLDKIKIYPVGQIKEVSRPRLISTVQVRI